MLIKYLGTGHTYEQKIGVFFLSDTRPIGIFDSGVGGLTVVKSLVEQLPRESFIYFGDTAHLPYGNKSREQLCQYARNIIAFLLDNDVKAIVVACGTHSSITLPEIEDDYPVPLLGVVKPGARAAVRTSRNKKIGIIATQASVNSGSYSKSISAINGDCQVFANACPRFVPLVESGQLAGAEVEEAVQEYIDPLLEKGIDTLVLGCTHYPFLLPILKKHAGTSVRLVDPASETVEELKTLLTQEQILNGSGKGAGRFLVSGNDQSFYKVGSLLLGNLIHNAEKVNLAK